MKLLPFILFLLILSAGTAQAAFNPVRDTGKTCFDYAIEFALSENENGGNWGVVVAYYLPWSQEQTHYHAYEVVGTDLHVRGMYKHHELQEWVEYDYWYTGDWYKRLDNGGFATNEYFFFWEDPLKSARTVKKVQIQDNREHILNIKEL